MVENKRDTGRCGPAGELGARTLQLGRLAGSTGKVLRHVTTTTLFCFGNFMKKEGRSRIAGGGFAGEYCSPDTWRPTSWDSGMRAGWRGGERRAEMVVREGNGSGERELWPRPGWSGGARDGSASPSPSSFFSISFSRLVKNFTKRNFIFLSHPTPVFARHGTAELPLPGSSSNTYVPITFSFCLQKSSVSDTMEDRINYLCVGKRLQKYLHRRMKKSGYKNVYIGESFFAYVGNGILRPQLIIQRPFLPLLRVS